MELMGRFYRALVVQMSTNMNASRLTGAVLMGGTFYLFGVTAGVCVAIVSLFMLFQASSR